MSTIVSSFVQDRASGKNLPTASLISGAAKVWCLHDGVATVPVIRQALNVSSLQDIGPGSVKLNLAAPFVGVTNSCASSSASITVIVSLYSDTASALWQRTATGSTGALGDASTFCSSASFGDLA